MLCCYKLHIVKWQAICQNRKTTKTETDLLRSFQYQLELELWNSAANKIGIFWNPIKDMTTCQRVFLKLGTTHPTSQICWFGIKVQSVF